jgi:hypothetical protein
MSFIPSMIWLGLILLLQCFILNHLISIFTYVPFLYAIFIIIIIYFRINLKLKLLFFHLNVTSVVCALLPDSSLSRPAVRVMSVRFSFARMHGMESRANRGR